MELPKPSIFFLFFALFTHAVRAHIADFDEVWQERAKEAEQRTIHNYEPNPEAVTSQFNAHVDKALKRAARNTTRRSLSSHVGPCLATNPIDRCWRCQPNWAKNRKRYTKCALGFGRKTKGGKNGRIYVVTDPSDSDMVNPKPGTLRYGVIQKEPLWIIFAHDMVIRLSEELMITSHKTVDGRGAHVHIANGAGITLQFVDNVILSNLHIHDIYASGGGLIRDSVDHYGQRSGSDGDGISIFGSTNVWVDHMSMSRCKDGLIDAIMGSTAITLSNNHFTSHNEAMLFGASDSYAADEKMQITVAFNHFGRGLVQRMPRVRWGFVHVLNNDYTHWLMYAIGGSQHPTIISQGNRFIAPPTAAAKEVTKRDYAGEDVWKNWCWRSEGDLMMNGAFFVQSGSPFKKKLFSNKDLIRPKPGTFVTRLTRFAGALNCKIGKPC
ncbi:pectate lyase-like [Macadamia integrifolia]|uniref:pectate lyase-like n=1 Tax=Macadamia integrifolia TaxID=60698 RepID=UPI001C4F554A|nr:pectate lyase-like [Macadamia integrifolia]